MELVIGVAIISGVVLVVALISSLISRSPKDDDFWDKDQNGKPEEQA